MKCTTRLLTLLLLSINQTIAQQSSSTAASTSKTPLQFASPLQSFTIFDKSSASASPRSKFLPRLRAGLLGERRAKETLNNELRSPILDGNAAIEGSSWAEHSAKEEERRRKDANARMERGYDEATALYDRKLALLREKRRAENNDSIGKNENAFQFVGVIQNSKEVTWYARKKPSASKWNVRLIHVNRDAVLRDLFVKGKIDLYGEYKNEGMGVMGGGASDKEVVNKEQEKRRINILGEYTVKERSWRTFWNFSPIRYFTTPSGSYHRERRLTPGIYTDGVHVYESVYRYRDGKNGMKRYANLDTYMKNLSDKEGIMKKLSGMPDVVVEK